MLMWIKNNPLIVAAITLVGMALIAGYFAYRIGENKRHEKQLQEQGAVQERADRQEETLNRVEKSIEIERNPDPVLTNSVRCKYDRSANC